MPKARLLMQERVVVNETAFAEIRIWQMPGPVREGEHRLKYGLAPALIADADGIGAASRRPGEPKASLTRAPVPKRPPDGRCSIAPVGTYGRRHRAPPFVAIEVFRPDVYSSAIATKWLALPPSTNRCQIS